MAKIPTPRALYPAIEPYDSGMLQVSDLHTIYYEQSGNKDGNPVVYVHGGPGSSTSGRDRRFFDPVAYRIILFDQRGVGKSTLIGELKENTTWDLVRDMERIRDHLGVAAWVVFGGSWGSTLSLAYAEAHPDRVKALIVRGIFTATRRELRWSYEDGGANMVFPEYWEGFKNLIPQGEQHDLLGAYFRRLMSADDAVRVKAAEAWNRWEQPTSSLYVDDDCKNNADVAQSVRLACMECHYFVHGCFFRPDEQLLEDAYKLRDVKGVIIQGRYDMVCPAATAWRLHEAWRDAEFIIVPDAGHSHREPGIQTALLDATDKFKHADTHTSHVVGHE